MKFRIFRAVVLSWPPHLPMLLTTCACRSITKDQFDLFNIYPLDLTPLTSYFPHFFLSLKGYVPHLQQCSSLLFLFFSSWQPTLDASPRGTYAQLWPCFAVANCTFPMPLTMAHYASLFPLAVST